MLCLLCPLTAMTTPHSGQVGVGVQLGEPTGLTGKIFISEHHALDAALSYSVLDSRFYVHGNYLIHFPQHGETTALGHWFPYVGVGTRIRLKGDDDEKDGNNIAVRLPLGVSAFFGASPVELFIEIGPNMGLFPETKLGFDGGLGFRYLF